MADSKTISKDKRLRTILIVLTVTVIGLVVALSFQKSDVDTLTEETEKIAILVNQDSGVRGRACGIMSSRNAAELLQDRNLNNEFTNEPSATRIKKEISDYYWSDTCRYVTSANSNRYVELFIETYLSDESAQLDLEESLPKVGIFNEVSDRFDQLYYSAGAWFARDGNVVIKVSYNDSKTGDLKEISRKVFDQIVVELEV